VNDCDATKVKTNSCTRKHLKINYPQQPRNKLFQNRNKISPFSYNLLVLYMEGYSYKRIATILKIAERTVYKWVTDGNWKQQKVAQVLMKDNSVSNLMEIFEYQVQCLKKKKDEMVETQEYEPFKPGEFDALQKLYSTIKSDHRQFADYVAVMKELLSWLQGKNLELAQNLTELADEFLNEKHKVL